VLGEPKPSGPKLKSLPGVGVSNENTPSEPLDRVIVPLGELVGVVCGPPCGIVNPLSKR
jgi:hypothetical protein